MTRSARALLVLFIAGAVAADPYKVILHVGETLPVQVITGFNSGVSCHLTTPQGETIEFRPENQSTDRITYVETFPVSYCGANIKNLTEDDTGEWSIYYTNGNEKDTNTYHLTVLKAENEETSVESASAEETNSDSASAEETNSESASAEDLSEEDDTQWLTEVHHISRTGMTVDLSLSKKTLDTLQEETFTLTTPQNQIFQLENANIPGVTVHGKSYFVANRVTIGPMDSSMIGRWTLCGKLNTGFPKRRCQSITISWNSHTDPSAGWSISPAQTRDTVTNYMAMIYATVTGSGNLFSCHLITPDGEDLVITSDSAYPGLSIVPRNYWDTHLCVVSIGPIQKEFIGDWIVYARFRAVLNGVNEVRLPLHVFLYDEQNPYNQAYNVTTLDPVTRVVNLGVTTNLEVTGSGTVDNCEITSPTGQTFDLMHTADPVTFVDTGSRIACAISLGPIVEATLGEWQIVGKFSDRGVFTERRQTTHIVEEDPANPIEEDHRRVTTRNPIFLNSSLGEEHTIQVVPDLWFYITESCHLRTPTGLQYIIMDGFNYPGVEVIENSDNRCAVIINVDSENVVGEWMLISREQQGGEAGEVRQPFTIHVEENAAALSNKVTVAEGNDLYVRLANSTDEHDSCKLYDPSGEERTDFEVDARNVESCGLIVRNIQGDDSGVWQIRYGTRISYIANINVAVIDSWDGAHDTLVLPRGRSVNQTLGPDTAVYCKLTDPTARVVFEGFGRCNLALDRVKNYHAGTWTMDVGLEGSMLTREYKIAAQVRGSDDKPTVTTYVAKERPEVTLKCSVPVEYEVRSCLFKEPSGRVIMASEGVAQDRYIFHGAGTTINGDVTTHECGLRIADPATADLGLWRCAVQTEHETYYGFLTVLCPWAMGRTPLLPPPWYQPTLTADQQEVQKLEGDTMSITCSIQSPIRYCYFRARNGTIFNVSPGVSSNNFEYVGAGLDAGECGIRFDRMIPSDTGRWSCHVGLPDSTQPEQRVNVEVQINRAFQVNQIVMERGLRVEGQVANNQPVKYCRYVRMDGLGFTSATLPDVRYFSYEDVSRGLCAIKIENPNILEMHSWTIAAKVVGQEEEVSGVTDHTIQMPAAPAVSSGNFYLLWSMMILTGALLIGVGCMLIPRKNRENTIARATAWRESFRHSFHRSFRKAPLPADDETRSTPMSA